MQIERVKSVHGYDSSTAIVWDTHASNGEDDAQPNWLTIHRICQ